MQQIHPSILMAAKAQGFSVYTMRGSDKLIMRRKRGPNKAKIKSSPRYVNMRRNSTEFGGRATAGKWIFKVIRPVKHIADYSVISSLNSILKPIQELDTTSEWGQRHVLLTKDPQLIRGFNLNRKTGLESVILPGINYTLSPQSLSARVMIPALLPESNFFNPGNFSWYRISAVLGLVPDIIYTKNGYTPADGIDELPLASSDTEWNFYKDGSAATEMELTLPSGNLSSCSMILVVGVSFGIVRKVNYIQPVKYTGAGKILGII
jgi:hypothetical protein